MKELIEELKALIINPKKGTTGYTVLSSEESVTAYKIDKIITKLEQETKK